MNSHLLQKKNKGFTLVETLVAIAILSISILGTFTAVQKGLQSSSFSKDQITAFYLVQEAMEYIRNVRDKNALVSLSAVSSGGSPVHWLTGLSGSGTDPCWYGNGGTAQKACVIDSPHPSPAPAVFSCSSVNFTSCPVLKQDMTSGGNTSGLYGYTGSWTDTRFKRGIKFTKLSGSGDDEVLVTISISWTSGQITKTFQVDELLFNTN